MAIHDPTGTPTRSDGDVPMSGTFTKAWLEQHRVDTRALGPVEIDRHRPCHAANSTPSRLG